MKAVVLLVEHGADVAKSSALEVARENNHTDIMRFLENPNDFPKPDSDHESEQEYQFATPWKDYKPGERKRTNGEVDESFFDELKDARKEERQTHKRGAAVARCNELKQYKRHRSGMH